MVYQEYPKALYKGGVKGATKTVSNFTEQLQAELLGFYAIGEEPKAVTASSEPSVANEPPLVTADVHLPEAVPDQDGNYPDPTAEPAPEPVVDEVPDFPETDPEPVKRGPGRPRKVRGA